LRSNGTYVKVCPLFVYKPDGTPASFSPLKIVTTAGVPDTMVNNGRGLDKDEKGNILASYYDKLYRINYKTGAGIGAVIPKTGGVLIKVAADDLGEVFTGPVIPGAMPVMIFDNAFTNLGNAFDTTKGYSRSLGASSDGNDVYFCTYSPMVVLKIHSDNGSLGPYNKIDSLFTRVLAVESISWHPKTGYLWVSSGNNFAPCNKNGFTDFSFYAFKLPNYTTPVDSFKWNGDNTNDPRPRGIAFSPSGDTVYVCQFNDSKSPVAQMFVKGATSVKSEANAVVTEYALGQNYPNPFNPSTTIKFSLPTAGNISLKVYDVLGKEVATLAEGRYEAGAFTATFDAKNVNSGVYFYTLRTSNGFVQSNKMLLMK